jgi:hypothetical protein
MAQAGVGLVPLRSAQGDNDDTFTTGATVGASRP